ncbi:phage tail protein [Pseudomonas sp. BGr12]|uniref:phage tail protein n=1 Tax=unclassified Pseudomonas TaxID=196821 RepID=UPI001785F662|nr:MULTISPECIES: phage tail protein [unclassified Pseudomonas]MBD9579539.1 phage tail protein [Pseudomonas sp. PDM23]MBD9674792.1 phage tail protein [Pseudomonas sp. PDM21]MDL2431296.1 phage tail protein [Pseudomonas sp. BJa5]
MAVTYYALLTTIGAGKLANATALGTTLKITQLAVGDGGGDVPAPDASRTQLVNEVRRAPLNRLSVDPANSAQIIAEQVIPEDVGGWWIREMGLYDEAGALIAYANCAPSYKPQLAEGSGRTQTVRIVLIVSNAASVELKIDPSVVLATREYVDNSIVTALNRLDYKQSVRAATTASVTLSGLQTVDGVALAAGDRVLVKNQTSAVDNGLYVVAAGVWKRATDADENSEVTPGLTVTVESGTAQADSVWQLVTDGVIVLGTTALAFQNITNGLAKLASPAFSGVPTAPTAAVGSNTQQLATTAFTQAAIAPLAAVASPAFTGTPTAPTASAGSNTQQLATTAFVQAAGSAIIGAAPSSLDTLGKLASSLGNNASYAASVDASLQAKAPLTSPALVGTPTAPTAALGDNTKKVATTEFVQSSFAKFSTTQTFPITFANGFFNRGVSTCWTANGNLYLSLNMGRNTVPESIQMLAFTLPVGARPKYVIDGVGGYSVETPLQLGMYAWSLKQDGTFILMFSILAPAGGTNCGYNLNLCTQLA